MGFGKGIATGILTVAYPEQFGVWNNTSEAALRQVGLWPNLLKGEGIGGRYEKINNLSITSVQISESTSGRSMPCGGSCLRLHGCRRRFRHFRLFHSRVANGSDEGLPFSGDVPEGSSVASPKSEKDKDLTAERMEGCAGETTALSLCSAP